MLPEPGVLESGFGTDRLTEATWQFIRETEATGRLANSQ